MARLRTASTIVEAGESLRQQIYRARHEVYAEEIGQHQPNAKRCLTDSLDAANCFLAVTRNEKLAGFVSITPPGAQAYSIDKYFDRGEIPISVDASTFEIRLLTVVAGFRNSDIAALLMLGAFRWIEARGGTQIVAIGRREVKAIYHRAGLYDLGLSARCGAVTYDLMHGEVAEIRAQLDRSRWVERLEPRVVWNISPPLRKPAACFHGGAFFDAVGADFDALERRFSVINADVLDAWFDPAPRVLDALREHLPWLAKTSPPTACDGLISAISQARGLPEQCILPGAGSSDLMFRILPRWLNRESRVVILDPTYGEYAHILEGLVACGAERLSLHRNSDYKIDLTRLRDAIATAPDLVILVNPNSPTGTGLCAAEIEKLVVQAPKKTRFWIDETYVDYTGESVETLVPEHDNLVVCKSMSKAYALSGLRVGYVGAAAHLLEALRAVTPPWVVSLPAQVAAVSALLESEYYRLKWQETHCLRAGLAERLREFGWEVFPACANYLLAHLPLGGPSAEQLVAACRRQGLFLRNASPMGSGGSLGAHAVRIAVKDAITNERMLAILEQALPEMERTNSPGVCDHVGV